MKPDPKKFKSLEQISGDNSEANETLEKWLKNEENDLSLRKFVEELAFKIDGIIGKGHIPIDYNELLTKWLSVKDKSLSAQGFDEFFAVFENVARIKRCYKNIRVDSVKAWLKREEANISFEQFNEIMKSFFIKGDDLNRLTEIWLNNQNSNLTFEQFVKIIKDISPNFDRKMTLLYKFANKTKPDPLLFEINKSLSTISDQERMKWVLGFPSRNIAFLWINAKLKENNYDLSIKDFAEIVSVFDIVADTFCYNSLDFAKEKELVKKEFTARWLGRAKDKMSPEQFVEFLKGWSKDSIPELADAWLGSVDKSLRAQAIRDLFSYSPDSRFQEFFLSTTEALYAEGITPEDLILFSSKCSDSKVIYGYVAKWMSRLSIKPNNLSQMSKDQVSKLFFKINKSTASHGYNNYLLSRQLISLWVINNLKAEGVADILEKCGMRASAVLEYLKNYERDIKFSANNSIKLVELLLHEDDRRDYCDQDILQNPGLVDITRSVATLLELSEDAKNLILKTILNHKKPSSASVLKAFAESPFCRDLSLEQIREIVASDFKFKGIVCKGWVEAFEKNRLSLQELLPLLSEVFPENSFYVEDCIKNWLDFHANNVDIQGVLEILSFVRLVNQGRSRIEQKTTEIRVKNMAKLWLRKQENNPETIAKSLTELSKASVFNIYDTEQIAEFIRDRRFNLQQIIEFANILYPELEASRTDFLIHCFDANLIQQEDLLQNLEFFKNFISSLQHKEQVLDLLENVALRMRFDQFTILKITEGRLRNKYESLAEILDGVSAEPLCDLLTQDGFQHVVSLFGEARQDQISLSALFSYYSLNEDIAPLMNYLKPEIKVKIQEKFQLSDKRPYIKLEEYDELRALLGDRIRIPNATAICNYLKNAKQPTKLQEAQQKLQQGRNLLTEEEKRNLQQIISDEISKCKVNFGNSRLDSPGAEYAELLREWKPRERPEGRRLLSPLPSDEIVQAGERAREEKAKRDLLNKEFIELLHKEDPSDKKIIEIFGEFFGEEFAQALNSSTEGGKFCDFFRKNKYQIADFIQQKDGLQDLAACVTTLGDGCVHNISTQFTKALYTKYIKNRSDLILYLLFSEKVVDHVAASGIQIIDDRIDDPLQNDGVRNCLIVPNGFFAALRREFFDETKTKDQIKENSLDFLEKLIGDHLREDHARINPRAEPLSADFIKDLIHNLVEEEFEEKLEVLDEKRDGLRKVAEKDLAKEERLVLRRDQGAQISKIMKEGGKYAEELPEIIKIGVEIEKIKQQRDASINEVPAGFAAFVILNEIAQKEEDEKPENRFAAELLAHDSLQQEMSFYREFDKKVRAAINVAIADILKDSKSSRPPSPNLNPSPSPNPSFPASDAGHNHNFTESEV